ncbi:Dipeptidyl peptidase family member 6 [Mycena kentingensis (nom. inval.)]|nr:Dipeptidyl peptidase family member 6 [Mycena kentingensis (nom. inval.)]
MQLKPALRPYGRWPSPIAPRAIAEQTVAYEALDVDPVTRRIYHAERNLAAGRSILVDSRSGKAIIPKDLNCRSIVHGYGGAPFAARDGRVYFANVPDLRVYRIDKGGVVPVTPNAPHRRFANLTFSPNNPEILLAVCEDATGPKAADTTDTLVSINPETGASTVIARGADFYANPTFSPSGSRLAYLRWNQPDQPFLANELVVAEVCVGIAADGSSSAIALQNEYVVAGAPGKSIAQQPLWIDDDTLVFLHDPSGYIQPWVHTIGKDTRPIFPQPTKIDFAEPMWGLGASSMAVLDSDHLLCVAIQDNFAALTLVTISSGASQDIPSDYVDIKYLRSLSPNRAVFVGSKIDAGEAIVIFSYTNGRASFEVVATASKTPIPDGFAARPDRLTLRNANGDDLHALYFPPTNPEFVGLSNETPPCVVSLHPGPTTRTTPAISWERLLYTSRGWAWYAGRKLQRLHRIWTGIYRTYIWQLLRSRSAGLCRRCSIRSLSRSNRPKSHRNKRSRSVLPNSPYPADPGKPQAAPLSSSPSSPSPNFYAVANAQFNVCNLAELQANPPKLQMHYLPLLLGGTPEEIPEVYKARSPLFAAKKIRTPLFMVHGALDPVVPASQTDAIADELRSLGGRVEYLRFEDEGRGLRKAENSGLAIERQLKFFEEVFGFS